MNDLTNDGASAPGDDTTLFDSVVSGGAEPSEDLGHDEPVIPTAPATPEPAAPPVAHSEPAIPPSRLREEADARRNAERERDELRGRLAAFEQRQQPQQQKVDPVERVLSDPTGLIREEAQSLVDPFDQRMSRLTEFYSQRDAVREHGQEKVQAAFAALDQAAKAGDPEANLTVQRVKQSMDPFGDIVRWHQNTSTLAETKGDLTAYRQRILDEATKDPEFIKRIVEGARQSAQQAGNNVHRPVSAPPRLNNVGAAALPENMEDVSDSDLFASTTRRRRTG